MVSLPCVWDIWHVRICTEVYRNCDKHHFVSRSTLSTI